MHIKYFANIRPLTGCLEQEWTAPAHTLRELLQALAERHGEAFRARIFPGGKLHDTIIVLVNGQHIVHLHGLDTQLQPEDTICIFPMVAGG